MAMEAMYFAPKIILITVGLKLYFGSKGNTCFLDL